MWFMSHKFCLMKKALLKKTQILIEAVSFLLKKFFLHVAMISVSYYQIPKAVSGNFTDGPALVGLGCR